jgi:hypothetical protein
MLFEAYSRYGLLEVPYRVGTPHVLRQKTGIKHNNKKKGREQ